MSELSGGRRVPDDPYGEMLLRIVGSVLPSLTQFQLGRLPEKRFVEKLRAEMYPEYNRMLAMEKKVISERDKEFGMETQTTDTVGAHNLEWFTRTNLIYATGIPTSGIAAAIVHPEIGMSAAHRNLVTIEDVIHLILTSANSPIAQNMIENAASLSALAISNDSLTATAAKTISDALSAFRRLAHGGIPITGTYIMLVGGSLLNSTQQKVVIDAIRQTVGSHQTMNDGRALKIGRTINIGNEIGNHNPNGVLWGGPGHNLYPNPVFYTSENLK